MLASLDAVRQRHEDELLALPNVAGVDAGTVAGRERILVLVTRKVPLQELRPQDRIPRELEGYPVEVLEVGDVSAF